MVVADRAGRFELGLLVWPEDPGSDPTITDGLAIPDPQARRRGEVLGDIARDTEGIT